MLIENSFEGGSDETTITTGNSGGASGTAFDQVETSAGAVKFDSARAAFGSLSARIEVTAGSGTANVQFRSTAIGSPISPIYTRHYVYFSSYPTTNVLRHLVVAPTAGGRHASYQVRTDGTVRFEDANFLSSDTGSGLVLTGEWCRFETRTTISPTGGQMTVRVYNQAGSLQGEVSHSSSGSLDTESGAGPFSGADLVGVGQMTSNTANCTFWVDGFAVSDVDWIGDAVVPASIIFPHRMGW